MLKNKLPALLMCLLLVFSAATALSTRGASQSYTVAQVESLRDGIVAYNGAGSAQALADGMLCRGAGVTSEFYAIALSQSGDHDFSRYESALLSYLDTHTVTSGTSREKYALALLAAGSTDRYIADAADNAIGDEGVMNLVFGLHLLNNGCTSARYTTDSLISELLSCQKDDGGWAVMGSRGDVDVTAMTLQALAPHYGRRGDLTAAVDRAVELLSQMQLDSGGFRTMGAENSESAAQVVIALSSLNIDAQRDGRFIKNGVSAFQAMMSYRLSDGSFAHTGDSANFTATEEAYCALTAYARFCYGQGPLYVLDHARQPSPSGGDGGSSPRDTSRSGASPGSGNSSHSGQNSGANGDDASDTPQTDAAGNPVIIINGRRYIEATTASGEKMTVALSETAPPSQRGDTSPVKPSYGGFQPTATADSALRAASADEAGGRGGYKVYAVIGIAVAAGAACAVLFLLKKRNKKHYIAVAVIAAAGIVFILLTDFQSADSFRQPVKTDGELTVTLTIRCDTVADRKKVNDFIPDDGVILDTTAFTCDEGDTVFDVLMQAVSANDIPLDNRGTQNTAYIAGINGLYEFDYGELSGWMYRVNGEFPDVGCRSYTLSDGDKIEWLYTTNIGKDLE